MNLKEQLRGNFPKTIDKSKPVFSSLIANDNNNAAIQKQLKDLFDYMKEWISTPNVYDQTGVMLEKTVSFFSFLERFVDETEKSFKNRFAAIFIRNHDTKWGTVYDVKSVFKQYFPHATIYVVENTNKIDDINPDYANLLKDGDIDTDTPTDWSLTNCTASDLARFSKAYGILMNQSGGKLSQAVTIKPNSTYFLHFFLKGKIKVSIKSNGNKFWDNSSKTWESSEVLNEFISMDDWSNQSLYFFTGENDSSVEISFNFDNSITYIDYFRLFEKQPYSSFTVIAHFEGNTAVGAFGLAAGDNDPNTQTGVITANISNPTFSGNGISVLPNDWDLKDCTMVSGAIDITDSMAMISKTITVAHSTSYNLSFTYTGKLSILVKDNNDNYFDIKSGVWKNHFISNLYISESSSAEILHISSSADTDKITIEIKITPPQPRYSNYGYYDKSFLSGVPIGFATDIYEDLLDYLRAQGVRAYLEIIIKDA